MYFRLNSASGESKSVRMKIDRDREKKEMVKEMGENESEGIGREEGQIKGRDRQTVREDERKN